MTTEQYMVEPIIMVQGEISRQEKEPADNAGHLQLENKMEGD